MPGEQVKLGVRMTDESGEVIVESVVPGSTADNAGVKEGDIILKLSGVEIKENFDLVYEVGQRNSGDQAKLIVLRDGEQVELNITFIPMPAMSKHDMGSHKK